MYFKDGKVFLEEKNEMTNEPKQADDIMPLVLFQTSRGRIINLLMIESFATPNLHNPKQPFGCYMASGVFHTLDESEFDFILHEYAEIASSRYLTKLGEQARTLRAGNELKTS